MIINHHIIKQLAGGRVADLRREAALEHRRCRNGAHIPGERRESTLWAALNTFSRAG